MSTKITESCPACKAETLPLDKPVAFNSEFGLFPVRLWRYKCECDWVWANAAQRKHNSTEYDKGRKAARSRAYGS